jgi:peroxidase
MKRRQQQGSTFGIERLEDRQMMAADLMLPPAPMDLLPDDNAQPVIAAEAAATSRTAPRPTGIVIPIAAAEPRSYDGTGNNLVDPELGSTDEQLMRVAESEYGDGISTPAGAERPSAREISNALSAQDDEVRSDRQLSAFIYAWGQFVDHDIDLTEPPTSDKEAFNIEVPAGDELFDPDDTGTQEIGLTRSRYDASTGTDADNPREQINEITAWIDGSAVYGSDQATADSLRSFVGGKLLTSDGNLPPTDEAGYFLAGDVRANENVELTSMHTLFVREHNWWADQIARQKPGLDDEAIYQQARAIVIAEIQSITFNEFLPALLGPGAIGTYQGYDPTIDPSIANEFSTAAYRMHTLINDDVEFFGNDGRAVSEEVELADAFFNPDLLREEGADSILKYLASTTTQEVDLLIVDGLRNFLFGLPGQGGFDLASLNIQRGRDHGLADYNSVREAYGLERATSFDEISSDPEVQQKLEALYGSVDNIDLWVGTLAEDHLPGSSVGQLSQTIIADQFARLRDGDRLWFENIFSGRQLQQLENTTLADVISRNTTVNNLQENVFFLQSEIRGQLFIDGNANGRQDRAEAALPGVTVELLNDEGDVIATTVTNGRGRYQFSAFSETGDYQIRIVVPNRMRATTATTRDVLISRGDQTIAGVDFGLQIAGRRNAPKPRDRQLAAVDAVFAADQTMDPLAGMMDLGTTRKAKRGARPR